LPSPNGPIWWRHTLEIAEILEDFAKGSVLFDGSGGRNYMVHASRREGPGMVEVHTRDADILYVLKGSAATIVTGGTMVDANRSQPTKFAAVKSPVARRANSFRETSSPQRRASLV
jgi:hypothetical protein